MRRLKPCASLVIPLAFSIVVPLSAQATCSRDDVDHYLEKGFTPSQITAICRMAPVIPHQNAVIPAPSSVRQSPQVEQPGQTYNVPPSTPHHFMIDAINGYDTILTAETLSYTKKQCYDVGEEDLFGFSPEVCPEIRYTLHLKGMKMIDTTKKYFLFGPSEIQLEGQVQRDIISDLGNLKPEQKEILLKKIDIGDKVALPIQQGTPMARVKTELQKILY